MTHLPMLGMPGSTSTNEIGQFLPLAVSDTTTYPGSDYYEIALVEYREQMHPDLPPVIGDSKTAATGGGTQIRGYVQIETPAVAAKLAVAGSPSKHIPLKYPGGAPILVGGSQVYAVDEPHYLGPTIVATSGRAVRLKFSVLLPTGSKGKLFIPNDATIMGAADGPRITGTNDGVITYETYTDNRATIHLHGGVPPWISDGTPHQWVTALGEETTYQRGDSAQNVPDMPDPGEGALTFYFPNQMSARLQFYHDHSFGLTGPNVYVGEAAGYLIQDQPGTGEWTLPGVSGMPQIPLVIQDRTFVPDKATVDALDPTWNTIGPFNYGDGLNTWGTNGNFWYPHVYQPNQNPYDESGWNPLGRWAYGPWFWPPWPVPPGSTPPNPTHVPEGFMDTPMVNGAPYPYVNVEPRAYRLRVLNACNDRSVNLSLWEAEPITLAVADGGSGYTTATVTIAAPLSGGTNATATAVIEDGVITGFTVTSAGFGYTNTEMPEVTISGDGSGATAKASVLTDVAMIPAVSPRYSAVPIPSYYPTADLRDGGWPDPRKSGPKFVHIGSEGGLLPAPVVHENRPIGYVLDKGSIVVLNVQEKCVNLGAAERADLVVDFSAFAGKTVILYNDSGCPVPAGDARYDLYTGNADQRDSGGPPSTMPGYGPNTRTVMQFRVANTTPQPWSTNGLPEAMAAAFRATQPTPIVPQKIYDSIGYTHAGPATNVYSRIQNNWLSYIPYGSSTMTNMPIVPKAIHELFDDIGRLNTILGTELPFTTAMVQTTVPLYYVDPITELYNDGEIQIWKITHNGVDTHPIHFHLYNVQVVNRVGWDNQIRAADPDELGWKETVRMNPLEDCIVAAMALSPTNLPFSVPDSVRPLNPARPLGSREGFSNLDPYSGNQFVPAVSNVLANFAWEYVWHCHILAHEENDMMRPLVMKVSPAPPSSLTASASDERLRITIEWQDNSPSTNNPNAEAGFVIERAVVTNDVPGAFVNIGAVGANVTEYNDNSVDPSLTYAYRVSAFNAGLSVPSNVAIATAPMIPRPLSPSGGNCVTNPVFTFVAAGGATEYRIIVWDATTGTYSRWYTAAEVGAPNGTENATIQLPTPLSYGVHSWAAQARNTQVTGARSATLAFTVGSVPLSPTPVSPSGIGVVTNPPFVFSAVPGAVDYRIVLWKDGAGFTYSQWYSAAAVGAPDGTGNGTITLPDPLSLGARSWAVYARNGAGTSPRSSWMSFTVGGPATPTQIAPASGSKVYTMSPTFQFSEAATATDYRVVIYDATSGYVTSRWYTVSEVNISGGTGNIVLDAPLAAGYHAWAIQARNATASSKLSGYRGFTISGPSTPTPQNPRGTISTNLPTYTFTAVTGATDYQIILYAAATGYTTNAWVSAADAGVPGGSGTGSITLPPPALTPGYHAWAITARAGALIGTRSSFVGFTNP